MNFWSLYRTADTAAVPPSLWGGDGEGGRREGGRRREKREKGHTDLALQYNKSSQGRGGEGLSVSDPYNVHRCVHVRSL